MKTLMGPRDSTVSGKFNMPGEDGTWRKEPEDLRHSLGLL